MSWYSERGCIKFGEEHSYIQRVTRKHLYSHSDGNQHVTLDGVDIASTPNLFDKMLKEKCGVQNIVEVDVEFHIHNMISIPY